MGDITVGQDDPLIVDIDFKLADLVLFRIIKPPNQKKTERKWKH